MPTNIQNQQVIRASLGFMVQRNTQTVLQALTSMFTITGGRILIRHMYAKLTIATDASNATTITVGYTPSEGAGSSVANALAASSVVGVVREIGTHWVLGATIGAALTIGTTAATPLLKPPDQMIGPGAITYTGGVGVNPGSAAWTLIYTPLDPGVNVVAA
jgi:hypothetical protein